MKKREIILSCLFLLLPVFVQCQIVITVAGNGTGGGTGDGGAATLASIGYIGGIAVDRNGNLYIADGNYNRVRKVDVVTGIITTIAGNGTGGFNGDNIAATAAQLNNPQYVTFDTAGNLYISDVLNRRVRKVTPTGIISTFAGNGVMGSSGDNGAATLATLTTPQGLAADKKGNLYITDIVHRIRKVDISGNISTVAGTGIAGFSGDEGPATTAQIWSPQAVAVDSSNNLFIADHNNNRIRKVDVTTGIISTVAGNAAGGYTGDEIPATSSGLSGPAGIVFDVYNNFYIGDRTSRRVRKVDVAGIIHTIAGNGVSGYSGDNGPATAAQFSEPQGVEFDLCGNLFIADKNNRRIRKITYPPILTIPTISITGDVSKPVGIMVTINATVTDAGSSYVIHWMNRGVEFTTTTVPSVTYTKAAGIDTITARVVSTAAYGCYDSTTSSGWVVSTSGVEVKPLTPKGGPSIWPNPFNDELHIDNVAGLSSYRVVNIVGVVLQEGDLQKGDNRIPMHMLPVGIYMVVVNDREGRKSVVRMMKQ